MATSLVPTSEKSDELVILVMNTDFASSEETKKDKNFHPRRNTEIDSVTNKKLEQLHSLIWIVSTE